MTNKTITALIIRLAGFALFVKMFDFFGSYLMSIFISSQVAMLDETYLMGHSFDKLYISGTVLSFAHLFISLILILKADWIANKMVKTESDIKIDLTANSIMRIVIATIGIIYCAYTVYNLPINIENLIIALNKNENDTYVLFFGGLTKYILKAVIGIVFILKSEQLSNFALKKMKSR